MFILPRIAYYRGHSSGYPSIFGKIADDGYTIINEDEAVRKWNQILETICAGFHLYLEKDHIKFSEKEKTLWLTAKKYLLDYFEYLWN